MVFDNNEFGFWSITVERPLRLRVYPDREIPESVFRKKDEMASVREALSSVPKDTPLNDWNAFAKVTKLKSGVLKRIRPYITERDLLACPVEGEADAELRDTETVPFTYEGGIDAFMENEVLSYAPDAFVNEKKIRIGYEVSFAKYFYKPAVLRDMKEIIEKLTDLEKEADGVMSEIMEGIR